MQLLDAISGLLLVATPVPYLGQYRRLYASRSLTDVSLTATFLTTLAAQIQVVQMYYLFRCHPDTRYGSVIATPPSTRDWLGLSQITVQWACSLLLLILVIGLPVRQHEPAASSSTDRNSGAALSGTSALSLLAVHALISLAFALIAGKPLRQINNLAYLIIMSVNACIAIPLSTVVMLFAIHHQVGSAKPTTQAFNRTALALHCIIFLALAALWPFRLALPRNISRGKGIWWTLTEWYPYVGWAGVNAGVMAVGQYLILYVMASPV